MYDERQANASSMQNFIILFFLKSDKDLFSVFNYIKQGPETDTRARYRKVATFMKMT